MNLTPLEGFLAAMADSQFSWGFYLIALFQTLVAACYLFKGFRSNKIATPLIAISLLALPALLAIGFYYATRPTA